MTGYAERTEHDATQRVAEALAAAGLEPGIRELSDSTHTAEQAAAALGCDLGAIASSLVFVAGDEPVLVMTSGRHRVDTGMLAAALGAPKVRMASRRQVADATGQQVGGVSPVGHPSPVRTVVDAALAAHPLLWAAAGSAHAVFPITFEDLVRITGAQVVTVAAD